MATTEKKVKGVQPRLPETLHYAPLCRRLSGWRLVKGLLRLTAFRLYRTWYIWSASLRSLFGHIQIVSTRETPGLMYGPAFVDRDQCLMPNKRTHARLECRENLLATHPWVDFADEQIFLEGFDAGERWALRKADMETQTPGLLS